MRASHTISIHALCEEGDVYFRSEYTATSGISIHALCEEGDVSTLELYLLMQFLSTPSARRATAECRLDDGIIYISIHALCEEGDHGVDGAKRHRNISIHALCEEGDELQKAKGGYQTYFYPRPLRGGRPYFIRDRFKELEISIHALCEEGDPPAVSLDGNAGFLSTPSARRATDLPLHRCN